MVKIDKIDNNFNQTDSSANQPQSTSANPDNNQTPTNQKAGLLAIIGSLLPFAPMAFEQFTGQKIPQMTGTMAEIQMTLVNIQTGMQTIANNQQSLNQRLIALENSATNLTHQFKNLRLTHTKEQKQIEYGNNQNHHSAHLAEESENY